MASTSVYNALVQRVTLEGQGNAFAGLDSDISVAMKQATGFVSHVAAEKVRDTGLALIQEREFFQATLWRGDSFVRELSEYGKNKPLLLPRKGSPTVRSELGNITFVDVPESQEERPGTLCIATLTTTRHIGERLRRFLSNAHETLSHRPNYGGSCIFSPSYPRGYVYLFTWVHDTDRERIAREFSEVLHKIQVDGELRPLSFDVAKHLSWLQND